MIVDKNKVRRSKENVNKKIELLEVDKSLIKALYFDGCKDETIFNEKQGNKFRKVTKNEEHISVLSEPGSVYVGHVVPQSSKANDVCNAVLELVSEKGGFEDLVLIGCDGTIVNTGYKGGIIKKIEKKIGWSLQWSICLLHFNELPFRALFQILDGPTSGPKSFTGSIGKQLKNCENLPVVSFEKIEIVLPDLDCSDLSADQKYLLQISKAIQSGVCSQDLSFDKPGCLNHARWLTCANRILRLYISTSNPSESLKTIVLYLLRVYVPQWFSIRNKKSIAEGSRHLFKTIELSRYLPTKYLKVVNETISRNAFFSLPENIILSMITDSNLGIRKLGLKKILVAREKAYNDDYILKSDSELPQINFEAENYYEMIDWSITSYISPPVLKNVSNEELITRLSNSQASTDWEFCKYPCHTVAVERLVKLVTEASKKVCGKDRRNGYIRATLLSRQTFQRYDSKKQFPAVKTI